MPLFDPILAFWLLAVCRRGVRRCLAAKANQRPLLQGRPHCWQGLQTERLETLEEDLNSIGALPRVLEPAEQSSTKQFRAGAAAVRRQCDQMLRRLGLSDRGDRQRNARVIKCFHAAARFL